MAVRTATLWHLDACAGTGGISLALKLIFGEQLQTVAYVERESYAAAALVARMEEAALDPAPIWDNVKTLTCARMRDYLGRFPADRLIFSAGYPCQPFSEAGRRLGERDPRHLWPYIDQAIGVYQPGIVFLENVAGHLSLGFERVRRDLQRRGYRVKAGLFTAREVGLPHRRRRLFILALADSQRGGRQGDAQSHGEAIEPAEQASRRSDAQRCGADVVYARGNGWRKCVAERQANRRAPAGGTGGGADEPVGGNEELPLFPPAPDDLDGWRRALELEPSIEPAICRMADGTAHRLDRLRMCGNGVVPLAVAYAFVSLFACHLHDTEE